MEILIFLRQKSLLLREKKGASLLLSNVSYEVSSFHVETITHRISGCLVSRDESWAAARRHLSGRRGFSPVPESIAAKTWNLKVSSYCLMSNHYHLLVQAADGNLSRCMRHLNGVCTQRYNRRHCTDGQLFRVKQERPLSPIRHGLGNHCVQTITVNSDIRR